MKTFFKATGILALALSAALASGPAAADYRGHGHGYGHGHHGGDVRFGITFGVPLYGPRFSPAPFYGYPAYAYPPVVIAPAAPPVYIEQGTAAAPAQAQGDWYYCADSRAYYPYVAECPGGWQRVPAQPAR